MSIRIQKYLSSLGICSRREAEEWIKAGLIRVNNEVVRDLGRKITPGEDAIKVKSKLIKAEEPPRVYWMLHKPDECLTAAKSQDGKPTIFDLPKLRKLSFKVSPVGRLDYRTEGLLLLSNDGDFVFRLSHPKFKVPRTYLALSSKKLSDEDEKAMRKGPELEDGPVKKIELQYLNTKKLGKTTGYWYQITVYEGRNRLVRRLFQHFGAKVVRLVRTRFGDLELDEDLKPGYYRQLTTKEITMLKSGIQDP